MNLEQPRPTSGGVSWNQLSIDNCSIVVKRGETKTFNISFIKNARGGIGKNSFTPLNTSLNFTITPSEYIVKNFLEFPSVVSINADPSLTQGQYQIKTTINETMTSPTMVHCRDTDSYVLYENFFPLNVTVI